MSTSADTPDTTETAPSRLRYVLILGGLAAFAPLSIDMYLPALPSMTGDLHSSAATLQLTLSSFIIGLAAGQLLVGPFSDALGRRKPLLAGLALYATASALCAVAPDARLLVGLRAVQAFGAAAGIVLSRATVRDLFSGTAMTRFFSMLMLVNGLAPVLAPTIGGQLLRVTSWRGVFVVLLAFGVLLLVVVTFALPETLPPERRVDAHLVESVRTYLRLLRDRVFLGYALSAALTFASVFAYVSASSFALQDVYGLSPQAFGLVLGTNGLGIVLAGQLNARLVGHLLERKLLTAGLLAASAGGIGVLLAVTLGWGLWGLLVPLFVLVSSIGMVLPNTSSLALAEHAGSAGSASALLGVLQFVVGGLTTPLVGLGGARTAVPMAVVIACFAVLALLTYLTLASPRTSRDLHDRR
jgi:DHA1 family bicyclomycin/chloramphenicol resistance-like MFS transporter